MIDLCSYTHNLSTCEIKALKKKIRPVNSQCDQFPVGLRAQLFKSTAPVSQRSWVWIPFRPDFFCLHALIPQLLKLCVQLRWSIIYSYLSPQFKYMVFHILTCIPHHLRVYCELTIWPAPSWLDSSVGRALHRYCIGHGFESCSGLIFFQALISQLLKLCV